MANNKVLRPWHLESQSIDYETPWFQILKQNLVTSSSVPATFYIHNSQDSVVCVCLDDQNRIMLERQYRPAVKKVSLDYPAGHVETSDSSTQEAIRREMLEEAGFEVSFLKELAVLDTNPGFSTTKIHLFLARGSVKHLPKLDETESIDVSFVTPNEILKLISDGEMACAFCVSATFMAFVELGFLKPTTG
jgi:ADP-ribose pyrophosphatase